MEPRQFTFGDETEEETRGKQLSRIRAVAVESFVGPIDYTDSKRVDPRFFIEEARRSFFMAAQSAGLNAHEALHSWTEGIDVEYQAGVEVTSLDYCSHKLAAAAGMSQEEFLATKRAEQEQIAQLLAEIQRRSGKAIPPGPESLN